MNVLNHLRLLLFRAELTGFIPHSTQPSNHSDLAIVQTLTLDIDCQESFIASSADQEPRSQTVGPCRPRLVSDSEASDAA